MAHIDYYLATISPYCYLAGNRLEQIAAKHGATITYKPLNARALFERIGTLPPEKRHPALQTYRRQELRRWAKAHQMDMTPDPAHFPTNPAPSSYAIIAAQEKGADVESLVQAFARACWAEDRDIADETVIRDVLDQTGHDPELANQGLFIGAEIFGRNLEQAVEAGVFGVPFYIVTDTDERFFGQDRLDLLDRYLGGQ